MGSLAVLSHNASSHARASSFAHPGLQCTSSCALDCSQLSGTIRRASLKAFWASRLQQHRIHPQQLQLDDSTRLRVCLFDGILDLREHLDASTPSPSPPTHRSRRCSSRCGQLWGRVGPAASRKTHSMLEPLGILGVDHTLTQGSMVVLEGTHRGGSQK